MALSDEDRRRIAGMAGQPVEVAEPPDLAAKQAAQRRALYKWLWMDDPPVGEIEASANMNIYEFEAHQRAKPAFKLSPRFKEEAAVKMRGVADRMMPGG